MYQITTNNQSMFTEQWTQTFSEIYPTLDAFKADYEEIGLTTIPFKNKAEMLQHIYYILMGEYANSAIANLSEDQFKVRLFTMIMSYGPQYERELEIQKDLLETKTEDLQVSSKSIANSANNPSQKPTTQSIEELPYINAQNVVSHKRSKMDAYAYLLTLLNSDITREFIKKFDKLFTVMLKTNYPLWYITKKGGPQE